MVEPIENTDPLQLLTYRDVSKLTQISVTTLYDLLAKRKFPQPIRFGAAVRWRRKTVLAWMEQQEKQAAREDARVAALALT